MLSLFQMFRSPTCGPSIQQSEKNDPQEQQRFLPVLEVRWFHQSKLIAFLQIRRDRYLIQAIHLWGRR